MAAWAAVIWTFSTDLFSGSGTGRLLLPFLELVLPGADPETLARVHLALRKIAHVAEYAILALLVFRAFDSPRWSPGRRFAMSFAVSVAWASVDELHQTFVASRVGALSDVALDSFGAALGLAGLAVWRFSWGRRSPT